MEDAKQTQELKGSSKGKDRANQKFDDHLALELYENDLEDNKAFLSDGVVSRSMAQDVHADGGKSGALESESPTAVHSKSIPYFPNQLDNSSFGEAQIMRDDVLEELVVQYVDDDTHQLAPERNSHGSIEGMHGSR